MERTEAIRLRLKNHLITEHAPLPPGEVVRRLGAMQAQDLPGAKWSAGLRSQGGVTDAEIEAALARRDFVRTWPMRGTLHFVAPEDARWMVELSGPRMRKRTARRRAELELTDSDLSRAADAAIAALSGGHALTRAELLAAIEQAGISTASQRGYHLLYHLSQDGLLVMGPMHGKQQAFVLAEEWLPRTEPVERDEALACIADRFFRAHGPATVHDLGRWAGLLIDDARRGLAAIDGTLEKTVIHEVEHWFAPSSSADDAGAGVGGPATRDLALLPPFDEYLMGYADRRLIFGEHYETYHSKVARNGMVAAVIVSHGEVIGTWKRTSNRMSVDVTPTLFRRLKSVEQRELSREIERYRAFLDTPG